MGSGLARERAHLPRQIGACGGWAPRCVVVGRVGYVGSGQGRVVAAVATCVGRAEAPLRSSSES